MKKFITISIAFVLSVGTMIAQTNYKTVKGYVVDKNGNPIPGAEVTTPGGGESVITDSDGSFNMSVHPLLKKLSASYDGMTTKTLKIQPEKDLVFTLKKERKNPAFISASFGLSYNMNGDGDSYETYEYFGPSWSLMAGMLGKWGFYGKGNCDWNGNFSITVGAIKSIYKHAIFMYAGLGYGMAERYFNYEYYDEYYNYNYSTGTYSGGWRHNYDWNTRPGIAGDFGFIFKTGRHFNITVGYSLISTLPFTEYNWYTNSKDIHVGANYVHYVQGGIGYVF